MSSTYQSLVQSSQLTFDDEFNSFVSSPNGTVGWRTSGSDGGRTLSQEAEYYSDSSVGVNPFSDSNGILSITATVTPANMPNADDKPFTSGIITSYNSLSQTYGYFEIRSELPAGSGMWPAFWLLPENNSYNCEIDVYEVLGQTPGTEYQFIHITINGVQTYVGDGESLVNTATGFHTYGVDWEPTTTTFYIDGQSVVSFATPAIMDTPMYMLANVAIGDHNTWPGYPTSNSEFPATMQIDYVRAYATANTIQVGGSQAIKTGKIFGALQLSGVGWSGATLSLLNAAGIVVATTTTNSYGNFVFTTLAAGNYQVKYAAPTGTSLAGGGPANTATGLTTTILLSDGETDALATQALVGTDPGPTGGGGSFTLGHGQHYALTTKLLALVTPGFPGDTDTITAIKAVNGTVTLASGAVTYQAPAGGTDTLTYTVTDSLGKTGTFTTGIIVDPGPQLASGSTSIVQGKTAALGSAIAGLIAPGLAGDTDTISSVKVATGTVTLGTGGAISFTAPSTPGSDTLTYTVTDEYGDVATGTYGINVLATPGTISGNTSIYGPAYPSYGSIQGSVTVSLLNAAGTVVATTVSSASAGYYLFTGVAPGTYQLEFQAPAGEVIRPNSAVNVSTGLTAAFTLASAQSYTAPNAGFVAAAVVTGTAQLAGAGLAGVSVAVLDTSGNAVATATTGSSGTFAFNALEAGTYQVQYTAPPADLLQSGPASATTGLTSAITLVAGQTVALGAETFISTGAPAPATITGTVLLGSTAQAGVTVTLLDTSGNTLATTTTSGSAGAFSFANLAAGKYQVRYTAPPGDVLQSGPASDSTGLTGALTLAAGQTLPLGAETLAPAPATITGTVLLGSTALAGATVTLLDTSGNTLATTTTSGSAGAFSFANLAAGKYQVRYTAPPGDVLQSGPASDSTGLTGALTLAAGQTLPLGAETLAPAPATITGTVLLGSTALAGATVTLLDTSGNTLATTTTSGSAGAFSFANLAAGKYQVQYTAPPGDVLQSGPASDSTGLTGALTLAAGQTLALGAETLAPAPATITGTVLLGSTAQAGVTVTLLDTSGNTLATTTTSGSAGAFSFANLAAGKYQVQYTAPPGDVLQSGPASDTTGLTGALTLAAGQTLPLGAETLAPAPTTGTITGTILLGSTAQAGVTVTLLDTSGATLATATSSSAGAFSFANLAAGTYQVQYTAPSGDVLQSGPANAGTGLTGALTLAAGQTLALGAETLAASAAPAVISGLTAIYGPSYPSWGSVLGSVTVALVDTAGDVVATTVSSASAGWYIFRTVTPGTYQLQFTAPSGEVFKPGSTVNVSTGLTTAFAVAPGQSYVAPNAGFVAAAAITGTALLAGVGVSGLSVVLLNAAGAVVATTTTTTGGAFSFNNLEAGTYQVQYTALPGELLQSGPASNGTGLTGALTLTAGQTLALGAETLISTGAPAPGTITGSVLLQGAAQAGVAVTLLDASGNTVASTTSDGSGAFSFANVPVGTYQVQYTAPSGEVLQYGPANAGTGLTGALTLAAGQTLALGAETLGVSGAAGNVSGNTSIYGPSYPSWGGVQGSVAVALVDDAGDVVATTVSSAGGGWYIFRSVLPGSYQLQFTAPSGEFIKPGSAANVTTGLTAAFTVAPGQSYIAPNAGFVAAAAITGSTLLAGAGVSGETVTLLNAAGAAVATTTTDTAGAFSFTGLLAGTYQVRYAAPPGAALETGSEANAATGLTPALTLASGQTLSLPAELLLSNPATVQSDVLHFGGPADPAAGSGEAGVTVSLLNAAGSVIASTTTGAGGTFSFGQLAAGTYQLQYAAPSGQATAPGAPESAAGLTAAFTVAAGQTVAAPAGALISAITFNGAGASTVAGAGSYLVTGNANNSILTLGAGNQTVTLTGSTDTVVTGDGNQTITLAGIYNHVTVGTGTSTITAGSGYSSVHAAGGTVTINAGGPGNLFDGGTGPGSMSFLNADGSAGNVFMLNAAGQGLTTITGFNPAASDVLDLNRTLAGTGILPDISNIASFVTAAATGANTTLYVDPTGGQATPQVFAVLNGLHSTVAQLQAAHAFSLA